MLRVRTSSSALEGNYYQVLIVRFLTALHSLSITGIVYHSA